MKRFILTLISILTIFTFVEAQKVSLDEVKVNKRIRFKPIQPTPADVVKGDVWFSEDDSIPYYYNGKISKPINYNSLENLVTSNISNRRDHQYLLWDASTGKWVNDYNKPPHSKLVFIDSATVISGGTNVQLTNSYDSLYRVTDLEGLTYLKGDTIQIIDSGGYNIICSIRGYGTNAVDWHMRTAMKRNGVVTLGEQAITFTTIGATNRTGGSMVFYNEYKTGDKIWLVLTRESGSGNFTATSGNFNIQLLYRR